MQKNTESQPIFLAPGAVISLMIFLVLIFAVQQFALDEAGQLQLQVWLGFWPVRFTVPDLPGGQIALVWQAFTHGFLHGSWSHVILNSAWLLVFGTPVARRFGSINFAVAFLIGCAAGALVFTLFSERDLAVLIGASGGVSALTGLAMRFMFQPMLVVQSPDGLQKVALGRRIAPISAFFSEQRARAFAGIWLALNLAVPIYNIIAGEQGVQFAWQAHIGGFVAGVLLGSVLKPIGPRDEHDLSRIANARQDLGRRIDVCRVEQR